MARPELSFYTPLGPFGSSDQNNPLSQGSGKDLQLGKENRPPQKIPFTREMFLPEDSIGYTVFSEDLEGRMRSEAILTQPLTRIFKPDNPGLVALEVAGITSLGALLRISPDHFESVVDLKNRKNIKKRLQDSLKRHVLTSHARLLQDIFSSIYEPDYQEYPVPKEREQELIDAVNGHLNFTRTSERNRRNYGIIDRYYGLSTDLTQTCVEIGREYLVEDSTIAYRINTALKRLRHPIYGSKELKRYMSLPPSALGRKIFGFIFEKDIPRVSGNTSTELLSSATLNELSSHAGEILEIPDLLKDLLKFQLRTDIPALSHDAAEDIKGLIEESVEEQLREQALLENQQVVYQEETSTTDLLLQDYPLEPAVQRKAILSESEFIGLIGQLQEQGFDTVEKIQKWLLDNKIRFMNRTSNNLVVRAVVEYVINHPDEEI